MSNVSLDAALSGLRAAQQALNTASVNIANASTPGYTRKTPEQETQVIAGRGVGVTSTAVSRAVNYTLIRAVNQQAATSGAATTTSSYLDQIQNFFGASSDARSTADKLAALSSSFLQLSTAPDNGALLSQTLSAATQLAKNINDYGKMINNLRQQADNEIGDGVRSINDALDTIASLNSKIATLRAQGIDATDLQDQRDTAINNVAQYMDISTFETGSGIINVMTSQGDLLADTSAHHLSFAGSSVVPTKYYPGGGLSGITIDNGRNVTDKIGGKLGALFDLRDETLPTYQAQMDEFSQKLATRFSDAGLKLFVDPNGNVPSSADPTAYTGFSMQIQVNPDILDNPDLLREGTSGNAEDAGSNEVIRRVSQFVFGTIQYQDSTGSVDISDLSRPLYDILGFAAKNSYTAAAAPGAAQFSTLGGTTWPADLDVTLGGVTHTVSLDGTDDVASLAGKINAAFGGTPASVSGGALKIDYQGGIAFGLNTMTPANMTALGLDTVNHPATPPASPVNNRVTGTANLAGITQLSDLAGTTWPDTLTIALDGETRTISLVGTDTIDTLVGKINTAFGGANVASKANSGALALTYAGDITLSGAANMGALGLTAGTKDMPDPSFSVQAGTRPPVTVAIDKDDTAQDLVDKINNTVPGVTASLNTDGKLVITPDDGGDITLLNVSGLPVNALGMTLGTHAQAPFSQTGLGADGTLKSGLLANSSLQDFVSSIIATQSEDANIADDRADKESSYLDTLETRNANFSGVNIDEEMASLIRIQSAYTAAARMVSASQSLFDDLFSILR